MRFRLPDIQRRWPEFLSRPFSGRARRATRFSVQQLRAQLPDVRVAGVLPELHSQRIDNLPGGIVRHESYVAGMRELAARVPQPGPDQCVRILVTSAHAGEGRSTVALNLAAALARNARTMLVDADLRSGGMSRRIALSSNAAGMTELLSHDAPYRACLTQTTVPRLFVIRSGRLPPEPLQVLRGSRLKKMLDLSAAHFRFIVVDSPALGAHADAAILARLCSTTLLVADAAVTTPEDLASGCDSLKQVNAKCSGIVLNRHCT